MERLNLKYTDALHAFETLNDILMMDYSVIIRDATIQRFEYTFEACWKFVKEYLKEKEGIICNSPKSCFRELFSLGFLSEEETVNCLDMTDKRNETSHTYKEELARIIFDKIQDGIWTCDKGKEKGEPWEWVVNFDHGDCGRGYLWARGGYVRAVRSGQSSAVVI